MATSSAVMTTHIEHVSSGSHVEYWPSYSSFEINQILKFLCRKSSYRFSSHAVMQSIKAKSMPTLTSTVKSKRTAKAVDEGVEDVEEAMAVVIERNVGYLIDSALDTLLLSTQHLGVLQKLVENVWHMLLRQPQILPQMRQHMVMQLQLRGVPQSGANFNDPPEKGESAGNLGYMFTNAQIVACAKTIVRHGGVYSDDYTKPDRSASFSGSSGSSGSIGSSSGSSSSGNSGDVLQSRLYKPGSEGLQSSDDILGTISCSSDYCFSPFFY